MKFIHTADIHYGMKPDANKPWAAQRSAAVNRSIQTIVSACKKHEVDCLLISGDLFHRQPLMKELKEIGFLFSTIPQVKVLLIAGNHDHIQAESPLNQFEWPKNVHFIKSENISSIYFQDINTEVFGFSYHSCEIYDNRLEGIKAPLNDRINILMAHGGDAKHLPLNKAALGESGFSYCALGHIHKHEVSAGNNVVYPGSPEPLDSTETGKHGFYLGEINAVTRRISSLSFVPCADISYISLVINVSPASTNTELLLRITEEIHKRGVDNIYKLTIRGPRDPDIDFEFDSLHERLRISEIVNESEPNYDFSRLFTEHSSDMLGFFINELNKPELSNVEKKALFYGVDALVRTADERS